jgi:hypothetical protein
MNRLLAALSVLGCVIALSACSKQTTNQSANQPPSTQANAPLSSASSQPITQPGELQVGQASGTYTAKGEVVELKYAYAGRGQRFGKEATIILLTDNPIPADALSSEIDSQNLLEDGKLRGLQYVIDEDGLWLRFYPGPYQESTNKTLKEYKVEGDIIRAVDEDKGDLSDGRYQRSVKFVAAMVK